IYRLREFFQQHLRFFEIYSIKPLSEPAVDVGQHLSSFFFLALALPQSAQAHHRPQLQRLRLLPPSNFNSLLKTRFGFGMGIRGQGSGVRNFELSTWNFEL